MALERLVFYSSLPCGRAKQIVPALFSKSCGMRVHPFASLPLKLNRSILMRQFMLLKSN